MNALVQEYDKVRSIFEFKYAAELRDFIITAQEALLNNDFTELNNKKDTLLGLNEDPLVFNAVTNITDR